jgi:hypothetical protein
MKWAYGVTTVPSRLDTTLPKTLESLRQAGFNSPRLFVDGIESPEPYHKFGLPITTRYPAIRTASHWVLSLYELYLRECDENSQRGGGLADRYAIFQDDFITYKNLRQYLERCTYPEKSYWNLYTFPCNQMNAPNGGKTAGWYQSNQMGKGALALVFDREAVTTLLQQQYLVVRPQCTKNGFKSIDGGIVTSLRNAGYTEYVHNPTLVQHIGIESTIGNINDENNTATSFAGETFDALSLL